MRVAGANSIPWFRRKRFARVSGWIGIDSPPLNAGTKAANSGLTTCEWEVPLIPSRIHKVLSMMAARQVRVLLMGGQACVFYGAAEFSRDTDLLILGDADNLQRLTVALQEL